MIHIKYTRLTQFSQPTWLSNELAARRVYRIREALEVILKASYFLVQFH